MLSEQEKKLLATAETRVKAAAGNGLERYLTADAKARIQKHPSRAAWSIHFYGQLCRQQELPGTTLENKLLDHAYALADAAVAYDAIGQSAFDLAQYLADRKLQEEFIQVMQRCRGRLLEPSIKMIVLKMAHEICSQGKAQAA